MKLKFKMRFFIGTLMTGVIFLFSSLAIGGTNQNIVYQGRIVRPDGTVANTGIISFTLSVYSPAPKRCLLYSETQSVNMAGSQGMFSLKLGDGTRTSGVPAVSHAFISGAALSGLTCGDGSATYTPAANDDRDLVVSFNDSGTVVNLSAVNVQSVPYALQSNKIDGWGVNDIVKIHPTTGSPTTFTASEMANAKALAGASCANNEILKWNGTTWTCSADATGGAPSDASYSAKGIVQFDTDAATSGVSVTSGVAKLSDVNSNVGSFGGAAKAVSFTVNAQGRITAASETNIALPVGQLTQSGASNGEVLKWNGSAWAPAADATGTSPGDATFAAKGLVQGLTDEATSGLKIASGVISVNAGTGANQIVKLDFSGKLPAIDGSALTNLTATGYSGVLPVANGGTNSSTALNNDRIMVSSGGKIVEAAAMNDGQILVGDTGGAPVVATVGQSNGISITAGAGSFSIGTNATSANTVSTIVSRDASGNFAAGAVTNTSNILKGSSSGQLTMTVPGTVTPYTLTWPAVVGGAGSFLTTDASGNLSWGSPAAIADASYAGKGAVQFDTDAATSGVSVTSGVAKVNTGTGANQIVKLNGSSQLPAVDGSLLTNLDAGNLSSGVLPIARGGTNNGSLGVTAGGVLYVDGTKAMTTAAGTSGQALISAGAGAPAFGTLSVGGGGTGQSSFAPNSMIMANVTGTQLTGMTCSPGQILKWNAGGTAWECSSDATGTSPGDASYAAKGIVQFDTDMATSGVSVTSGVAKVNTGTGANQIVKLDGSAKLPAVDGSALTNVTASAYGGVLPIANGGTNSGAALNNNKVMVSSGGAIIEGVGFGATNTASTFVTRDASGNFAAGSITNTSNVLKATSGALTMAVPSSVTDYTLTWPSAVGAAGSFLTTDASGNLSWGSPAAVADASYAAKGAVQGLTDAATSGLIINSGVISVNSGTAANQIVKLDGSAKLPVLDGSALTNLSAANITAGTLPVDRGGTGAATLTSNGVLLGNGTSAVSATAAGAAYSVLRVPSGGGAPIFGAIDLSQSAVVTGVLPPGNGGTGQSSFTAGDLIYATGATATTKLGIGASGTIMTSSGSAPQWSTISSLGFFTNGGNSFGAAATLGTNDNFKMNFEANGATAMTIDTDGTVGIGTTSPVSNFHVHGGATGYTEAYFTSTTSGATATDGLSIGVLNTTSEAFVWNYENAKLQFGTNNTERMAIAGSGEVGIGTSPLAGTKLQVRGSGTTGPLMRLVRATGHPAQTLDFHAGDSTNNHHYITANNAESNKKKLYISSLHDGSGTPSGNLGFVFQLGPSSAPVDVLNILDTGYTGIGNITPTSILDIDGAFTQRGMAAPTVSATGQGRIYFDSTANKFKVSQNGAAYVDLVGGGASGVTGVTAGTGLLVGTTAGGTISTTGTLNINVGTGANQIVQLDGSGKLPVVDGSALTNLNAANLTSGTLAVSNGGTGASSFASNRLVGTNGTGTAQQAVTCSQNQVLSFDASGNYGCYNIGSIFSAFSDGGNTFTATATLGTNSNHNLEIETNGTTKMTILADGKVGVGTAAPSALFSVGAGSPFRVDANGNINSMGGSLSLASGSGGFASISLVPSASGTGALIFAQGDASALDTRIRRSGASAVTIDNNSTGAASLTVTGSTNLATVSGRVGVGTDNPQVKLEVVDGTVGIRSETENPTMILWGQNANTFPGSIEFAGSRGGGASDPSLNDTLGRIIFRGAAASIPSAAIYGVAAENQSAPGRGGFLAFHTTANTTASSSERMRIEDSGNVGIGTTDPSEKLEVTGNVKVSGTIQATAEKMQASVSSGSNLILGALSNGNIYRVTLDNTATITLPSDPGITNGMAQVVVVITQDGSGSRGLTWAAPAGDSILWNQGTTPTVCGTALQKTIYQFVKINGDSTWYGSQVWKQCP